MVTTGSLDELTVRPCGLPVDVFRKGQSGPSVEVDDLCQAFRPKLYLPRYHLFPANFCTLP